ncbi:hypothetical protein D3A96_11335 [Robertkochia marina]|nr:hypothetical protein D3A96_11335 [Robertkochia marina]
MEFKGFFKKYVILLLAYLLVVRFIQPYGLKLYYTAINNPIDNPNTIELIQSITSLVGFLINLIVVVFMIVDIKSKRLIDWLLISVTFLSPEIGITLFMVWKNYKMR